MALQRIGEREGYGQRCSSSSSKKLDSRLFTEFEVERIPNNHIEGQSYTFCQSTIDFNGVNTGLRAELGKIIQLHDFKNQIKSLVIKLF